MSETQDWMQATPGTHEAPPAPEGGGSEQYFTPKGLEVQQTYNPETIADSGLLHDLQALTMEVSAKLEDARATEGHAAAVDADALQKILNLLAEAARIRKVTDDVLVAIS